MFRLNFILSLMSTSSARIGILVLSILLFLLIMLILRWLVIRRGKRAVLFTVSLSRSIRQAIISNPDVQRLVVKHPILFSFLKNRLTKRHFSGRPLTLLIIAFAYTLFLLLGLIENLQAANPGAIIDRQLANLLYTFRSPESVLFFLWVTFLGNSLVVAVFTVITTVLLWLWRRRRYILPLWLAIIGSIIVTFIGKLSLHRPRPDGLIPVYVEHSYSFPSSHATLAVAFYGFLIYCWWRSLKRWTYKINLLFAGLVLIILIGFSRLYLGVHFLNDVLSGYLLGLLWVIISVSIVEWQRSRRKLGAAAVHTAPNSHAKIVSYSLGILAVVFYCSYVWLFFPPLLTPVTSQTPATLFDPNSNLAATFTQNGLPQFTETLAGNPQEPISFVILAQNDTQLVNIFQQAGWHLANSVSLDSMTRSAKAALSKTSYDTAPITPYFWYGQVNTFGFEKPTDKQIINQRHHARFWRTNLHTADGKIMYVGTASFDISIKWLVTHKIRPDIDTERDSLLEDLHQAGVVASYHEQQFVNPTLGKNFAGDEFFTDGQVYIVVSKP